MSDAFKTVRTFEAAKGKTGLFYSLPALEEQGVGPISKLPVSIRIVLESVLRNCDGKKVAPKDIETLANWNAKAPATEEIPFVVARIVLVIAHRLLVLAGHTTRMLIDYVRVYPAGVVP